jgi:radical SAM protein with 4Fe4S-binding SPASM domain
MPTIGAFSGYLSSAFPSQINVDITMFCNLACIHCPYETITKLKGAGRTNLSLELHEKLVREIAVSGKDHCRFLRYTGDGEPLMHPHLAEMIASAKKHTGLPINLTSNGMLMSEEKAKELLEAGVDVFDISIDAHSQDVYGKVRVKGRLPVTQEATHRLIRLAKAYGGKAKVMVSFVRQPLNLHEADPFYRYWTEAGADFVVMRNLHSCAGNVPDMAEKMWSEITGPRRPCLYPWERLVLKADGEITYCPADWEHTANIGNFKESSITEIWQGKAMQELRQAHVTGNFEGHSFCKGCPDWSVIKWPEEGRSYASVMHEFNPDA